MKHPGHSRLAALVGSACLICATAGAANPYLPLWEYIPDGEPYIFEDPDNPGKYRVYIYGSHDIELTAYCGRNQVVWSAPVDDLLHWRYDGVIFESVLGADGKPLNADGKGDILYAPDVVEKVGPGGKKTYYLYPNTQAGGRNSMIARSDRPDGPFTVCNWSRKDPKATEGVLGFDPGVFIDDDGRVYGYWGFQQSWGAELDPETMCTVKKGTQVVKDMVSNLNQEGVFRFFEASSLRKIKDKYVFVYSRWTAEGEFGLRGANNTLAYAWSNSPLGPWTYGGMIIDARARDVDDAGNPIYTASPGGNTHGSLLEVGGQWYIFYHRQAGLGGFDRQAMVAPVEVKVTEGPDGKVEISEAEYTSEGFELNGLNPRVRHSAGIACYYTGPTPAEPDNLGNRFSGSYIQPFRPAWDGKTDPYDLSINHNPVVNNTAGSVVGYKYFDFNRLYPALAKTRRARLAANRLLVRLIPQGVRGRIVIMADHPRHGTKLGVIRLSGREPQQIIEKCARVPKAPGLTGKHALYFVFESNTAGRSLCELEDFVFVRKNQIKE
ncbi:MAG: family 43 glycosylhydrolase [Bacteroidales bacterium]|nr:family 43 glycosylhydrolase [Bacteroidales bacterium]